jgi:hypothetical protein
VFRRMEAPDSLRADAVRSFATGYQQFESPSLRQHCPCEQSLRLLIGPEKPRNPAVFRGQLCTLEWRRRLGITL